MDADQFLKSLSSTQLIFDYYELNTTDDGPNPNAPEYQQGYIMTVEDMHPDRFISILAVIGIFALIVTIPLTLCISKERRDDFIAVQMKHIGARCLFTLFVCSLCCNLSSIIIYVHTVWETSWLDEDWPIDPPDKVLISRIFYEIGKWCMSIFFVMRLHFIFNETMQKVHPLKLGAFALLLTSSVIFSLYIIIQSMVSSSNSDLHNAAQSVSALAIDATFNIVVTVYYCKKLLHVVIHVAIIEERKRTMSGSPMTNAKRATEILARIAAEKAQAARAVQLPEGQSWSPRPQGEMETTPVPSLPPIQNTQSCQMTVITSPEPRERMESFPSTTCTRTLSNNPLPRHEAVDSISAIRTMTSNYSNPSIVPMTPTIDTTNSMTACTPSVEGNATKKKKKKKRRKRSSIKVKVDNDLISIITKSTVLNLIGVLSSCWIIGLYAYRLGRNEVGVKEQIEGGAYRCLDGLINTICLFLVFQFSTQYYEFGCRCCQIGMRKACKKFAKKAAEKERSHEVMRKPSPPETTI